MNESEVLRIVRQEISSALAPLESALRDEYNSVPSGEAVTDSTLRELALAVWLVRDLLNNS